VFNKIKAMMSTFPATITSTVCNINISQSSLILTQWLTTSNQSARYEAIMASITPLPKVKNAKFIMILIYKFMVKDPPVWVVGVKLL
jgi:hypothetical protein